MNKLYTAYLFDAQEIEWVELEGPYTGQMINDLIAAGFRVHHHAYRAR